jgi:hypothetical protein
VNIVGIKRKRTLFLVLLLIVAGVIYLIYPRAVGVSGSIDGNATPWRLERVEKDNYYYISVIDQRKDKEVKLKCTKEQYDLLINEKEYHIFYRVNFFNRRTGKILELDDKPIYHGNWQVA